ncbi:MAG: hypothetical protein AABO41_23555 [Acidobacteriota bacterium]
MSTRKSSSPENSPRDRVNKTSEERIPRAWFKELDILRRILDGSGVVNKPQIMPFGVKGSPSLHVTTVSTSISMSDFDEVSKRGYKIYIVKEKHRPKLRKEFLTQLEKAAEVGAKLVCFNELAYPTPVDRAQDKKFQEQIKEIVAAAELFLIAGSYHHPTNFYNISPIFSPVPLRGEAGRGPRVYSHAKLTSAVRVEEMIRIPSDRNLRYYETQFGSFTILICLDAYDPALVLRLMRMNYQFNEENKVDVVFVPSFNVEKGLSQAKACRDLSYATGSLVAYVNCAATEPRHAVYLAGHELPVVKKDDPVSTFGSKAVNTHTMLHEVSYDFYHKCRTDRTDEYNPIFTYLIGQKRGLRKELDLLR